MHSIIMHDFYSVCLYVSAFGLSDLFVRVYKITSVKHLFYYYLSILCIAILSLYLFWKGPITQALSTQHPAPKHPPPTELSTGTPPQPLSPALHQTPYFHLSGNEWDIDLPVFYRETSIVFGPFNPHYFQVQKGVNPHKIETLFLG